MEKNEMGRGRQNRIRLARRRKSDEAMRQTGTLMRQEEGRQNDEAVKEAGEERGGGQRRHEEKRWEKLCKKE